MTTTEIFKKMLNWLYANKKAVNQTDVARKAGLNEVTVSRILNDRVKKAKQETLWAVNTAYGNIFNPEWLQGDSEIMLVADLTPATESVNTPMHKYVLDTNPDYSSMVNAIIAAKDDAIMALKHELAAKEEAATDRTALVSTLQQQVSDLRQQNDELRQQFADLRRSLDADQSKDVLKDYPFSLGVAEDEQRQRITK